MAFRARGAPDIAVAAFSIGNWHELSLIVPTDSPIKSVSDLKGKFWAAESNGSLPEHVAQRLSIASGSGPNGIRTAATGQFGATVAAAMSHAVDGFVGATEAGLLLQERGRARVISIAEAVKLPPYLQNTVYASESLVSQQPDVVKRFLQGLFASVAYMRTHKEESTAIGTKILDSTPSVIDKVYDLEISTFSPDGQFDSGPIENMKDVLIELGMLSERPTNDQLFTAQFVPAKP